MPSDLAGVGSILRHSSGLPEPAGMLAPKHALREMFHETETFPCTPP